MVACNNLLDCYNCTTASVSPPWRMNSVMLFLTTAMPPPDRLSRTPIFTALTIQDQNGEPTSSLLNSWSSVHTAIFSEFNHIQLMRECRDSSHAILEVEHLGVSIIHRMHLFQPRIGCTAYLQRYVRYQRDELSAGHPRSLPSNMFQLLLRTLFMVNLFKIHSILVFFTDNHHAKNSCKSSAIFASCSTAAS